MIDLGYDIEAMYDPAKRITKRQRVRITRAAADQRAGRTGRTRNGVCFRLYSEREFRSFEPFKKPEVARCCLDTLVLRLLDLGVQDIVQFSYLTPPDPASLVNSISFMKLLEGIDSAGRITDLGRAMGRMPIEPFLARAVV